MIVNEQEHQIEWHAFETGPRELEVDVPIVSGQNVVLIYYDSAYTIWKAEATYSGHITYASHPDDDPSPINDDFTDGKNYSKYVIVAVLGMGVAAAGLMLAQRRGYI